MNLKRGMTYLAVGLLLTLFTIIYYNYNITGRAVGDGVGGVGLQDQYCQGQSIIQTWETEFQQEIQDLAGTILTNMANCTEFIAYATLPETQPGYTTIEFLYGNYQTAAPGQSNIWLLNGFNGKYRATNRIDLVADHFQIEESQIEQITEELTFQEAKTILLNLTKTGGTGYYNWQIQTTEGARNQFRTIFREETIGTGLQLTQGYYRETDLEVTNNQQQTSVNSTYKEAYLYPTQESTGIRKVQANYQKIIPIPFTERIENFTFRQGTGDNHAFDIQNYIDNPEDVQSYGILYRDVQNLNGTLVEYRLEGTNVSFDPQGNFSGTVRFMAYTTDYAGGRNYSNQFSVIIEERPNRPPTLKQQINQITIPAVGVYSIQLTNHFTDPDNDPLTYRSTGAINTQITFNGNIAQLTATQPFANTENIRIYASDGELEVASNIFTTRYGGPLNQTPPTNRPPTQTTNNTNNNQTTTGFTGLTISSFTWVFILLGIILFFGIIGFGIWLYLKHLKEKARLLSQANIASQNQVNDYLQTLKEQTNNNQTP